MEKRYDNDYQRIINRLNYEFQKNKSGKESTENTLEDIIPDKEKLIEKLPRPELIKIRRKLRSGVEDIDLLTQDEKNLFKEISENKSHSYNTVVLKLTGEIDTKKIMKSYSDFINRNKVFRTVYFHKGMQEPLKVIYENSNAAFPICDIRKYDNEKQKALIVNVLAAMSRCEYDMETDSPFKICGYIIRPYELIVVTSIYPYIHYHIEFVEMIKEIFIGLKSEYKNIKMVKEDTLHKMNEQLYEKGVNYWKELLSSNSKHLLLPGERSGEETIGSNHYGKVVTFKEVGEELTGDIISFCRKNDISVKSLFMYAWGDILGRYNNEKEPVIAITKSSSGMNIIPVKIIRENDKNSGFKGIDSQLEQSAKYCECAVSDVEQETGIEFDKYFSMVQNFTGFIEPGNKDEDEVYFKTINFTQPDDTKINLFVNYQLLENGILITYTSKKGIYEFMLDKLNELLLDEIVMLMSDEKILPDKSIFIKADDTQEEKLHKINRARTALCLKNSGIFDSITLEEIIKLAEYCSLRTYLSGDTVINENTRPDKIYIVDEGKLEESMIAADGMVKSIRIAKQGAVFGQESLFIGGETKTTYTVVSSKARIVEIDKDIFIEVLRRKPEGWIALLQKENDQKCRLQRLWAIV